MMQFQIPFELPISQKTLKYKEISNEIYFNVLKYISSNDDASIETMFDDLVEHVTGTHGSKLYAADKFCLLVDLRSVTLGDTIEFSSKTNVIVRLRISDILANVRSALQGRSFCKHIKTGEFDLSVDAPRRLLVNDIDALISSTLKTIADDVEVYDVDDFNDDQKDTLLGSLPADVLNQMLTHINECKSMCSNIYIMHANAAAGIDDVVLNLFDSSMFEFLKSIYSGDLMNFYELQYSLITKMHISYEHFMKMTPNESRIYINLHSRDLKKQENDKSTSTPSRFNAA